MFDSAFDMDADWQDRDPLDDKADYDIHEEMELDRDMQAEFDAAEFDQSFDNFDQHIADDFDMGE